VVTEIIESKSNEYYLKMFKTIIGFNIINPLIRCGFFNDLFTLLFVCNNVKYIHKQVISAIFFDFRIL
jgi:hypothetical protein